MFNGWESWFDIIVISLIIYTITRFFQKKRAKKVLEQKKKSMNPVEFSTWLEEEKRKEEERQAEGIKKELDLVEKLNNLPQNKNVFGYLCLQSNNTLIVYEKFYYDKDEKGIMLSYKTFNTPEGYSSFVPYKNINYSRLQEDRTRFLNLKKELEYFNVNLSQEAPKTLKEK